MLPLKVKFNCSVGWFIHARNSEWEVLLYCKIVKPHSMWYFYARILHVGQYVTVCTCTTATS